MAADVHRVDWPIGPDYDAWVGKPGAGADDVGAWVAFKLKSASFHIDTLEGVGEAGGFSRLAGIEMALDAAFAALCGAFDAGVAGVISSAERYFAPHNRSDIPWKTVPSYMYDWKHFKGQVLEHLLAEELKFDIASMAASVDVALRQSDTEPLGWLTNLQRLRNRTVHQQSLSRHIDDEVGGQTDAVAWKLIVGRHRNRNGDVVDHGRSEHPVIYLRNAHEQLKELTDTMVVLVQHICPNGVPISRSGPS